MNLNLQKDHPPIEGNWWNPSEPTVKWHGTLILEATKSATLRLIGYDNSFLRSGLGNLSQGHKILHGTSGDGMPVTLSSCICTQSSQSLGSEEIRLDVNEVIFGEHLGPNDLLFDEVLVEFDYLNDWITHSRYQEREISDEEGQKEIRIRLNQDYQFPFEAPGYAKSLFYLGFSSSSSIFTFSIESRSNLQFTYSEKQSLQQILKDLRQWSWFLTLATRHETHLLRLEIRREDLRFDLGSKTFKKPLEVWMASWGKRERDKTLHSPDMNFTLPDIQDQLSAVISRWKTMQTPWAAPLHRYFASIHRTELQLQEQFLFRAQALEALYRVRTKSSNGSQKEAYADALEKAPVSLRDKLGSKESFVETVRINRNYLTHYSPEDEQKAAEFGDLFDLTQKLGFLLETAILSEIGLSGNLIENAIGSRRWGKLIEFSSLE